MPRPPATDGLSLRAIEAIYDAAPEPRRWPHALAAIAGCFDDVGAILIWHKNDGTFGTIVSESLAPPRAITKRTDGQPAISRPFGPSSSGISLAVSHLPIATSGLTRR